MATYRTTVILKTDIVDSTPRLAIQTRAEMGLQRKLHKQFIAETAKTHQGSVFQEEGDAYLIEFSSVTDAVLAAIDMHQNLHSLQAGKSGQQRTAIRVVIVVGDIYHQGIDAIGIAMNLTARIEKVTPANEIYLSHAAWLILNKAEVQTSLVNEFQFKGFSEPEKVYRVNQKHGIRVISDQCIVLADAKGFSELLKSNNKDTIESFLLQYDDLMSAACEKYGGVIRQVNGDLYFMTFPEAKQSLAAITMIGKNWRGISERFNVGLSIGVHKGNLHAFRSYVFGEDINITAFLSEFGRFFKPAINQISAVISDRMRDELKGTEYEGKLQELDENRFTQDKGKNILREYGAHQLMME